MKAEVEAHGGGRISHITAQEDEVKRPLGAMWCARNAFEAFARLIARLTEFECRTAKQWLPGASTWRPIPKSAYQGSGTFRTTVAFCAAGLRAHCVRTCSASIAGACRCDLQRRA